MTQNTNQIVEDLTTIVNEVLDAANLRKNDIFVLGCSTSEVVGGVLGKNSSQEVGRLIVSNQLEWGC